MPEPTYCDHGEHDGNFKGFFRDMQGWVACQECCKKMSSLQYKEMVKEHSRATCHLEG